MDMIGQAGRQVMSTITEEGSSGSRRTSKDMGLFSFRSLLLIVSIFGTPSVGIPSVKKAVECGVQVGTNWSADASVTTLTLTGGSLGITKIAFIFESRKITWIKKLLGHRGACLSVSVDARTGKVVEQEAFGLGPDDPGRAIGRTEEMVSLIEGIAKGTEGARNAFFRKFNPQAYSTAYFTLQMEGGNAHWQFLALSGKGLETVPAGFASAVIDTNTYGASYIRCSPEVLTKEMFAPGPP